MNSPALVLMKTGSRKVPVCGRNLQTALWASALVDAVLRRGEEIPLPSSKKGGLVRVRVNHQSLARFLQNVYADEPATVAEAIMALRKLEPVKAAWLIRVLQHYPELVALWRAVHTELTGEDQPRAG
jgi:hypothetical protein